ncbi:ENTH/VHS domain-containing protein [Dioscorea alata]|uniref:ENTH/VHS domain-containing protein n=1 Tax=Dioscorea alata TaxID=55571 RepID=A0ACB7U2V7_DIOAL|nr:ENTH/VHS domain-containing protein [Dioscorea alata]
MVGKLRDIVGALKDKASQTKASLLCTTTTVTISPNLAVLRATPHNPPFDPPHPHHLSTLLSFGSSPRPIAAALLSSLTSRLLSTRNASVALKSLLALHHLFVHGAFILRDQLSTALSRPSGSRHPLHLSSFRDPSSPESWTMSSWIRWFAGVLELLLASPLFTDGHDSISSLLNPDLLSELTSLVELLLETRRSPPFPTWEANALVREVVRVVAGDSLAAKHAILFRVREVRERLGSLDYADSVELRCLLRRLEDEVIDKDELSPSDLNRGAGDSFWNEIKDVRERIGELVLKKEFDKTRVGRDRVGESDRIHIRFGFVEPSRFGSFRLY